MGEQNKNSSIEMLEPQDTGLIKQKGWMLTQVFCLESEEDEETQKKALAFAEKLATKFDVALHEINDIEYKILEIYTK